MKQFPLLLVVLVLSAASQLPPATAQTAPKLDDGMRPYGSYHGGEVDSISLPGGNLNIHIPIISFPQRGGKLNVEYFLRLTSKNWEQKWVSVPTDPNGGYFKFVYRQRGSHSPDPNVVMVSNHHLIVKNSMVTDGAPNNNLYNSFAVETPDGSSHHLEAQTLSEFVATDSTGLHLTNATGDVPSVLRTRDGLTYSQLASGGIWYGSYGTKISDTNGNYMTVANGIITDTAGRSLPFQGVATTDLTGCQASDSAAELWTFPGYAGGTYPVKLCSRGFQLQTSFGYSYIHEGAATVTLVTTVVLPDGKTWKFGWDNFGNLNAITFPTADPNAGATITYQYANGGCGDESSRKVVSRTVTPGFGMPSGTWSYGAGTAGATRVTDPMGHYVDRWFTNYGGDCGFYETKAEHYDSSGALLKTVLTEYANAYDYQPAFSVDLPVAALPTKVTTQLAGGSAHIATTTYDSGEIFYDYAYWQSNGSSGPSHPLILGSAREIHEYKDEIADSNRLRSTYNDFKWQSDATFKSYNILNATTSSEVRHASCSGPTAAGRVGNLCSRSELYYDEYGSLTPFGQSLGLVSSGTSQRDTPLSPRANVTTKRVWNSGNGNYISSWVAYFDSGMPQKAIDALGHPTTYEYSTTYAGIVPTKTTNALNQFVTGTYDFNTLLPSTVTDANGQLSSFVFDSMLRIQTATFPDGGQTKFLYPDANTVHKQVKLDSTRWIDSYAYFDGVGRTRQTRLVDPNGDIYTDTTYNAKGQVWKVSNPYRSTSEATYGITETLYDGLGRATKVIPTDGTASTNNSKTDYSGDSATVTDQTGRQRRTFSDVLGRLIQVDEPGSTFTPATNSQAAFSITGTEQSSTTTTAGTAGTGSVTIAGDEGSYTVCDGPCRTYYDAGSVSITVNGVSKSVAYNRYSTATSVASALRTAIAGDTSYPATAGGTGTQVTLTARTTGAATNYSLSSSSTNADPLDFPFPSFTGTRSGPTLTGGANGGTVTTYDAGTVTLTVNGLTKSVSYGQGSTSSGVASALASAFNSDGSASVTATTTGATINLRSKAVGGTTNYSWTASSATSLPGTFAQPSFASSPGSGAMSGGADAGSGLSNPWSTYYTYDPLGNLLRVEQRGGETDSTKWRVRTFTYDSLARLLTATNPETGLITWTYDDDGNVLTKTALAPNQPVNGTATVTINYSPAERPIDELHRVRKKTYSNGDPSVSYFYDETSHNGLTIANGVGHRTGMDDASGSTGWTYDSMGREITERRTITGITKTISSSYNLDGSQATLTYPSGRVLTLGYDTGGKLLSAVDVLNNINYVTGAAYNAAGELTAAAYGANINLSNSFNKRLQPIFLTASTSSQTLLSLSYDYKLNVANNGNVLQIRNDRDTQRTQDFVYDQLNRVMSAQSAGTDCSVLPTGVTKNWGDSFTYDAFANLLSKSVTKCSAENLAVTTDAKNRINSVGFSYDAAGNLIQNGGATYVYDAEYRIVSAGGVTYTYDGDGVRVKKSNGTIYWGGNFSAGSLSESDASGNVAREYIYFGTRRVARRDVATGNIHYYLSDHINSSNVVVSATGTIEEESDFYPFGGERPLTDTLPDQNYKFTGKERDGETGLDYFGARYYASPLGRFMTPDWSATPVPIPYGILSNPQTLNLYALLSNNPLDSIDIDGHQTDKDTHTSSNGSTVGQVLCSAPDDCDPPEYVDDGSPNLFAEWGNVIEVSGFAGLGIGGSFQAGTVEYTAEAAVGVEGTIGLGGGNKELKVDYGTKLGADGKIIGGDLHAGGSLSTKDGANAEVGGSLKAPGVSAELKGDKDGVSAKIVPGVSKKEDIKVGAGVKVGELGAKAKINLSQAKKAWNDTVKSVQALGQYLLNKVQIPFGIWD